MLKEAEEEAIIGVDACKKSCISPADGGARGVCASGVGMLGVAEGEGESEEWNTG